MNVVYSERDHRPGWGPGPQQARVYCDRGEWFKGSVLARTPRFGVPTVEFYWGSVYYTLTMRSAREAYYAAHHVARTMAREGGPHNSEPHWNMYAVTRWLQNWRPRWPILRIAADYPEDMGDEY